MADEEILLRVNADGEQAKRVIQDVAETAKKGTRETESAQEKATRKHLDDIAKLQAAIKKANQEAVSETKKRYQEEEKARQQAKTASDKFFEGLKKGLSQSTGGTEALGAAFRGLGVTFLGVQGVRAIVGGFQMMMEEAAKFEEALMRVNTALMVTGRGGEATAQSLGQFAKQLQQTTGYADDQLLSMMGLFVQYGATAEQAQELVRASADLATLTGSIEVASFKLAKAMEGEITQLHKIGISIDEASFAMNGYKAIIDAVDEKFSGQAAARLETYAGKVDLMNRSWRELGETWGWLLTGPATKLADFLSGEMFKATKDELLTTREIWLKAYTEASQQAEKLRGLIDELEAMNPQPDTSEAKLLVEFSRQRYELLLKIQKLEFEIADLHRQGPGINDSNLQEKIDKAKKEREDADRRASEAAKKRREEDLKGFLDIEQIKWRVRGEHLKREEDAMKRQEDFWARMKAMNAPTEQYQTPEQKVATYRKQAASAGERYDEERLKKENEAAAALAEAVFQAEQNARKENAAIELRKELMRRQAAGEWTIIEEVRRRQLEAIEQEALLRKWSNEEITRQAVANMQAQFGTLALNIVNQVAQGIASGRPMSGNAIAGSVLGGGGSIMQMGGMGMISASPGLGLGLIAGGVLASALGTAIGSQRLGEGSQNRLDFLKSLEQGLGIKGGIVNLEAYKTSWEELGAATLGAQTAYTEWAQLISDNGGLKYAEQHGKILADLLNRQNMSWAEQADLIGGVIAKMQGLSEFEGDVIAVKIALSRAAYTMTPDERAALIGKGAEAFQRQQRSAEIADELKQAFQTIFTAPKGSAAYTEAEKKLVALSEEQANLQRLQMEERREFEARLAEQGWNKEDIEGLQDPAVRTAENTAEIAAILRAQNPLPLGDAHTGRIPTHHRGRFSGEHLAWIRNDEWVVPPESAAFFGRQMLDRTRSNYGSAPSIVVNVSGAVGNTRDVARVIGDEIYRQIERGEGDMARRRAA
jgi:hypothetical protein